jgi:GAF domain-containing protein
MPYVTCEHCGLRGFIKRGWLEPPECPHCGQLIGRPADAKPEAVIAGSLALLRDVLEMDVAMVSELRGGREIVRHAAGDWRGVADLRGASLPLEETFCRRMLEGLIGNVLRDVAADPSVRDLEMARSLGVGAWIGAPIRAPYARLYVLCCLAREARPELGDREVLVLEGFVRSVQDQLELAEV